MARYAFRDGKKGVREGGSVLGVLYGRVRLWRRKTSQGKRKGGNGGQGAGGMMRKMEWIADSEKEGHRLCVRGGGGCLLMLENHFFHASKSVSDAARGRESRLHLHLSPFVVNIHESVWVCVWVCVCGFRTGVAFYRIDQQSVLRATPPSLHFVVCKTMMGNSEVTAREMASQGSLDMKTFLDTLPKEDELFDKCLELGLVMHPTPNIVSHVSIALSPYVMQRNIHDELFQRQILWNEAIDRAARDFNFLYSALRSVSTTDKDFTGRLVRILEEVYLDDHPSSEGKPKKVYQKLMLGILRSDYMHARDAAGGEDRAERWKHVEINTISCSFAGLAPLVGDFHEYVRLHQRILRADPGEDKPVGRIARNVSGEMIPASLAAAVKAWEDSVPVAAFSRDYAAQKGADRGLLPVVLVVSQEGEQNVADLRKLLFELLKTHHIPSIRRTLRELHESMELIPSPAKIGEDGKAEAVPPFAVIDRRYVAAVVYFRSTYAPRDFPNDDAWRTRAMLERSNGIKCPSLPYHLMTFKKLQQLLCDREGVLAPRCFAGDSSKAAALAAHFMPQYSLNAEEYPVGDPEDIVREAIKNPDEFVLKPQLEGGGNIFHGEEMRGLLRDTDRNDALYARIRKEYILMRKIHSPTETTALFREKKIIALEQDALSELGIYGVVLSDGARFTLNEPAGYVVRTKAASIQDGGVMAGNACLNSLLVL